MTTNTYVVITITYIVVLTGYTVNRIRSLVMSTGCLIIVTVNNVESTRFVVDSTFYTIMFKLYLVA